MFTLGEVSAVSVLSMVLGGIANHFLTIFRAQRDRAIGRFNSAAIQLRAAFADELTLLRSASPPKPYTAFEELKATFPKHERAVFAFRDSVPDKERAEFDAAWESYYTPEGLGMLLPPEERPSYFLGQYIGLNPDDEHAARTYAASKIEVLLNFAVAK